MAERGRLRACALILVLAIHGGLLAYSAHKHSPTWDEYGHLVAGISHWEFGRFDLYRVNPPLSRTIAVIPVILCDYEMDWSHYSVPEGERPERWLRDDFIRLNGARVFWLTTLARWACIPVSLVGGLACYLFASTLYGSHSGLLAAALWCFGPNILGHGQLITPDVSAAALGVAAHYVYWQYLATPSMTRAIGSGMILGLTLLTKSTWIVMPPIWLAFWFAQRACTAKERAGPLNERTSRNAGDGRESHPEFSERSLTVDSFRRTSLRPRWRELLVIVLLGWYVLNLGYLFEGTFTSLGEYRFISRTLGGPLANQVEDERKIHPRNPYSKGWLKNTPVPFPKNFVCGIDIQKWDFERKMWSYLRGEWKLGGWWYYYVYAMAIKVPLGVWGLAIVGLISDWRTWSEKARSTEFIPDSAFRDRRWLRELFLLTPCIAVLMVVSAQTGFNHHMRYVLPSFPFIFIWVSRAAKNGESGEKKRPKVNGSAGTAKYKVMFCKLRIRRYPLVFALLAWVIASSLYYYPHGISYFNELVCGRRQGWRHLGNSNTDWGQDLLYIKEWCNKHQQARPLTVAYEIPFVPVSLASIDIKVTPSCHEIQSSSANDGDPLVGWHVVSVNQIQRPDARYAYFQHLQPVDCIGYSMHVYHVTSREANRLRLLLRKRQCNTPVAVK